MKRLSVYRRLRPHTLSYVVRYLSGTDDDKLNRDAQTRGSMHAFMQQAKEKRQRQTAGDKPWSLGNPKRDEVIVNKRKPQRNDNFDDSDYEDSDNDIDSETRRDIDMVTNFDHEEELKGKHPDDCFAMSDDEDPGTLSDLHEALRDAEKAQAIIREEEMIMAKENAELPGYYEEEISVESANRRRRGEKPLSDKEEEEMFKREARVLERNALRSAEAGVAPEVGVCLCVCMYVYIDGGGMCTVDGVY